MCQLHLPTTSVQQCSSEAVEMAEESILRSSRNTRFSQIEINDATWEKSYITCKFKEIFKWLNCSKIVSDSDFSANLYVLLKLY